MGNIFLPAAFPVLTATTADGIILTPMPDGDGTAIINAGFSGTACICSAAGTIP